MDKTLRLVTLYQLIRRDAYRQRQRNLIFLAVLTAALLLLGMLNTGGLQHADLGPTYYLNLYSPLLFIIGLLQAAGAFPEFRMTATLQDFLLLPASHAEKWWSRWLITLPLYLVSFTAAFWVGSLLFSLIGFLSTGDFPPVFQPWSAEVMQLWKGFVFMHSLLFIGAIQFNRNPLIKTGLALLLISILLSIIPLIGMAHFIKTTGPENMAGLHWVTNWDEEWLVSLIQVFTWAVVVPFFWWISYLKLTEKEV